MVKIQLEESKGKGGRHQILTCDQVSMITEGMSFDCQLGPQRNSAQMRQYAAKHERGQNVNS